MISASGRTTVWYLLPLALATLVLSAISTLFVLERAADAVWQWYKFENYGSGGFITLSRGTAWLFAGATAIVILVAWVVWQLGLRAEARQTVLISKCAAFVSSASLVVYFILASSPLNHWRS